MATFNARRLVAALDEPKAARAILCLGAIVVFKVLFDFASGQHPNAIPLVFAAISGRRRRVLGHSLWRHVGGICGAAAGCCSRRRPVRLPPPADLRPDRGRQSRHVDGLSHGRLLPVDRGNGAGAVAPELGHRPVRVHAPPYPRQQPPDADRNRRARLHPGRADRPVPLRGADGRVLLGADPAVAGARAAVGGLAAVRAGSRVQHGRRRRDRPAPRKLLPLGRRQAHARRRPDELAADQRRLDPDAGRARQPRLADRGLARADDPDLRADACPSRGGQCDRDRGAARRPSSPSRGRD